MKTTAKKKNLVAFVVLATSLLIRSGIVFAAIELPPDISLTIPGQNAASTGVPGTVANIYQFSLMIAVLLAFAMIVFAGAKYMFAAGNPSEQSDARDGITQALLGLLLLAGASVILNIINPRITQLFLPTLDRIQAPPPMANIVNPADLPAPPGSAHCNNAKPIPGSNPPTTYNQCQNSPSVARILNSCLSVPGSTNPAMTPQGIASQLRGMVTTSAGAHRTNSCHFGGTSCRDGSHAIDFGRNGVNALGLTLSQVKSNVEACAANLSVPVVCRFESQGGATINLPANDTSVNHIHCNVDVGACACN